jgi:hypothetical protein
MFRIPTSLFELLVCKSCFLDLLLWVFSQEYLGFGKYLQQFTVFSLPDSHCVQWHPSYPSHVSSYKPYFSLFPLTIAKTCSGGLVLFGCGAKNRSDSTTQNWCKGACWSLFVFPESPIYI